MGTDRPSLRIWQKLLVMFGAGSCEVKAHLQLREQRWKRSAEECCCRRVNQTCTSLSRLLQHLRSAEEQQSLSVCFSACRWWFGLLMAVTDVRKVLSSRWRLRVTESKHIQGCLRKPSLYYRTWLDKWYYTTSDNWWSLTDWPDNNKPKQTADRALNIWDRLIYALHTFHITTTSIIIIKKYNYYD